MNPPLVLEFLVQGSDPTPYKVTFTIDQGDTKATCTCKAGLIGILCKHRLSLLDGEKGALVSDNSDHQNYKITSERLVGLKKIPTDLYYR